MGGGLKEEGGIVQLAFLSGMALISNIPFRYPQKVFCGQFWLPSSSQSTFST